MVEDEMVGVSDNRSTQSRQRFVAHGDFRSLASERPAISRPYVITAAG